MKSIYQMVIKALFNRKKENNVASVLFVTNNTKNRSLHDFQTDDLKSHVRFTLNTIGIGEDSNPVFLSELAECNDGSYYFADDFAAIELPLKLIHEELDTVIAKRMTLQLNCPKLEGKSRFRFRSIFEKKVQQTEPSYKFNMKKKYFGQKGVVIAVEVEIPPYD